MVAVASCDWTTHIPSFMVADMPRLINFLYRKSGKGNRRPVFSGTAAIKAGSAQSRDPDKPIRSQLVLHSHSENTKLWHQKMFIEFETFCQIGKTSFFLGPSREGILVKTFPVSEIANCLSGGCRVVGPGQSSQRDFQTKPALQRPSFDTS
jgi:hypothetical protein